MTDRLPEAVTVSQSFSQRMPSQRIIDAVTRADGGNFGDIAQSQPFRVVAFRALLRDFPDYDLTALWMHAYDVELEIADPNPTNGNSPIPGPPSATIGASGPTT